MKVGTDGVLLGAWADCKNTNNILDIGAGTGLISIMLAQRSNAKIIGVELEKKACLQATGNINNCKWSDRIKIYNKSFQNYYLKNNQKFDLIVSNPPYFSNSLKPPDNKKELAKHNKSLPFIDLIKGVQKIMKKEGKFSLILPANEINNFELSCNKHNLYCSKKLFVKHRLNAEPKRVLCEFITNYVKTEINFLILETKERHNFTDEYIQLTKDFYLNF